MIVEIDAQLAWCPPTFRPSRLSRRLLALWIVHEASQRRRVSSASSAAVRSARVKVSGSLIVLSRLGISSLVRVYCRLAGLSRLPCPRGNTDLASGHEWNQAAWGEGRD